MLFPGYWNDLVAGRLALTAGVDENEAVVAEVRVGGEARRLGVGGGKKSHRVGMRGEEFVERRGFRTVRTGGQETAKKSYEISRGSCGKPVLAVGNDVSDAAAGQLEADGHSLGIGMRIAIGNAGHSGGVGETHDHRHRLGVAVEVFRTTQF